jgi:hypothetical protein
MPRNSMTKDDMKHRVLKLKDMLFKECKPDHEKNLAHDYLNKVLDIIEEYRM